MVFLEALAFNRVGANDLPLEIIVQGRIVGIHQRSGRVGLDSILEHAPVGIVAVDNARSDIGGQGEQAVLGRVHDCGTGAIFLTL